MAEPVQGGLSPKNCSKRPKSRRIQLYLVTWNVADQPPPSNLQELFPDNADVLAIGLQEMGNDDWLEALDRALAEQDVVRIKNRKLQGMLTVLYVQRWLLPFVTHIESEVTRTGFKGYWGNKGGVTVRFDLFGVNVAIVNCHLAAHKEFVAQRVEDINSIVDGQKFKDVDVECVLDHDYVFWMGDLNFRLDNTSYEEALDLLSENDTVTLLQRDQLKNLMQDGLVLPNFREASIAFPPTFKFDLGTDVYDTSSKKRVPAFCDRILHFHYNVVYGKDDKLAVKSREYTSHPRFTTSDHKPVSSMVDFLGLSRPPLNPVVFSITQSDSCFSPLTIHYSIRNMEADSSDWIGIFHSDFTDFDSYITYAYKGQISSEGSVVFSKSDLASFESGANLVACYFSKRNSFSGISEIFVLEDD